MNPCKSTLKNSEITDQVDTKSSKPKKHKICLSFPFSSWQRNSGRDLQHLL